MSVYECHRRDEPDLLEMQVICGSASLNYADKINAQKSAQAEGEKRPDGQPIPETVLVLVGLEQSVRSHPANLPDQSEKLAS